MINRILTNQFCRIIKTRGLILMKKTYKNVNKEKAYIIQLKKEIL